MAAYSYESNGLSIGSDFPLPELQSVSTDRHDVVIKKRPVQKELDNASYLGKSVQVTDNQFLLDISGVARFLVTDDRIIEVDINPGTSEDVVRLYLLSTVFSSILYKRNLLVMHASSVDVDGRAVLFSGASRAGKSTLALGLHKRGFKVLNDDISSVSLDNGEPFVYPGYRHLKLWSETMEKYDLETGGLPRLRDGMDKYRFTIGEEDRKKQPLRCIIMLEATADDDIKHEVLSSFESVRHLMQNTFRPWLVEKLGMRSLLFKMCSDVAGKIPVYKVYRPHDIDAQVFVSYLLNLIRRIN